MKNKMTRKKLVCVDCGIKESNQVQVNLIADGRAVCNSCESADRDTPKAWVKYVGYGGSDDEDSYPITIGEYFNDTDGEFEVKYHRTDGWRGYYVPVSKDWVNVVGDNILSDSDDSRDLKTFDKEVLRLFKEAKIRAARIVCSSSNLFSNGYDLFIPKADMEKFEKLKPKIQELKKLLRDDKAYTMTALGWMEDGIES